MGNSGSLHNVAIGLDESQYPYQYHQQFHNQSSSPLPHNTHPYSTQYPLHWTSSYSSTGSGSGPQSQPHIKVLPPEPSSLLRLRPTSNGTILQSGGTLSGRRESFNPALLLQRSRTTLNESPGFSRRISDTSVATPPSRTARPHPVLARRNAGTGIEAAKHFGSVPDLRISVEDDMPQQSDLQIAASKSRDQVKGEKKLASNPHDDANLHTAQPQRKLRLFRTKAESRKMGIAANERPAKLAAEASDFHFQRQYRDQTSNRHRDDAKVKPMPPVYRREKSFDITLLRSRNKDVRPQQKQSAAAPNRASVPSPVPPDKSPIIRQRSVDTPTDIGANRPPTRSRKFSQSAVGTDGSRDFKRELEAATKRRSAVAPPDPEPRRKSQMQKELPSAKVSSKSRVLSKIATQLQKKEQREEPYQKPANDHAAESKLRTGSKIPQLTNTFYFGMNKSPKTDAPIVNRDRDIGHTLAPTQSQSLDSENLAKIQMEVIDQFAKSIFTTPEFQREESESSESALSSDAGMGVGVAPYVIGHGPGDPVQDDDDDDENTGHIQVNIRPTLPRRQLEIPRFSPAAAWRMLAEERFLNGLAPIDLSSGKNEVPVMQTQPPVPLEGRIQRIYREPNPMYPDNKSGDSGISGDAGLPERVESPKTQRLLTSQVGPFLTAWTPQQDLDEDDESSSTDDDNDDDDGGDDGKEGRPGSHKYPSRGHTFSLSLPRENQLSIYEEKEKPGFSSLQKLKRTVSGVFAIPTASNTQQPRTNPTYCNDNWLLSRSAPNSIDSQIVADAPGAVCSGATTVKPSSAALSFLTAGKHVMYLPNQPIAQPETDFNASMLPAVNHNSSYPARDDHTLTSDSTNQISGRARQRDVQRNVDPSLDDAHPAEAMEPTRSTHTRKARSGHRFTFQSTIRQIERRRIADKLSKEAEQKEAHRLSELEAMRRVEEEFQRKRAGEKASIRHQLRLFSLEENQCISLPVDWQLGTSPSPPIQSAPTAHHMEDSSASTINSLAHQRAEPDGAVSSSPTSSPTLRPSSKTKLRTTTSGSSSTNARPTHYIRKDETSAKSSKSNARMRQPQYQPQTQLLPPQTEILSEFRTPRREYLEYRSQTASSSNFRHKLEIGPPPPLQQTQHNEVVCQIPFNGQSSSDTKDVYGHEPDLNGNIRHYYHERRDSPLNGSRKMLR